ncbi:MAG: RNA polymerase sigma factor [Solirubrobacteraceae bacterium]
MEPRDRFERLYLAHAGAVRRYAMRRGDSREADDVVAEVFLTVWRRLDEVPADPAPWLMGIAHGVLSNRRRGQDRHAALIARLTSEQLANSNPGQREPDLDIVRALGSLSASDQELLLLIAWEQLTGEQVAQVLGLGRGTIAVRLHRARRRLKRAMAAQEHPTTSAGGRPAEMEACDG